MLQEVGRVPVRWLLAMEMKESWERVDQAEGKDPVKALPGSFKDWRVLTRERFWGSVPDNAP